MQNETSTHPNGTILDRSRSLVPILERHEGPPPSSARTSAAFLAQLIAAHGRLPDQRERRLIAPDDASARYRPIEPTPRARLLRAV